MQSYDIFLNASNIPSRNFNRVHIYNTDADDGVRILIENGDYPPGPSPFLDTSTSFLLVRN